MQHGLGIEDDPTLARPLKIRLLGSGCDLLSCGVICDDPDATSSKINTNSAHVVIPLYKCGVRASTTVQYRA